MNIGKTERRPRTIPQKETVTRTKSMVASNTSSKGGPSTVSLEVDEDFTNELPKLDHEGHLMPEEVVRRTSSSLGISNITVGNKEKGANEVRISYAYRSQRGYYPDDPKKSNQDKYGITLNFAGEEGDAMFAVYDGHGKDGHSAAAFTKKKLPQVLAKHLRQKRVQKYMAQLRAEGKSTKGAWDPQKWPFLEAKEFEECCHKSFLETNELMHAEKSFTDNLCGTTAATVAFHAGRMTVCNVGDSRVLLGHRIPTMEQPEESKEEEKVDVETEISQSDGESVREGDILAIPLTYDQTPYRRDERERVEKFGAEIRSVDGKRRDDWGDLVHGDKINVEGDPPRLWFFNKDFPGTAFTRSLGDRMAEQIGVTADPEIITTTLTKNDEFLVIASDGIFEFLTNKYVMNVCATSATPLEACELLTRAAYDQWLVHENRTDDITVIVCFLSSSHRPTVDEEHETTESLVEAAMNA